MGVDRKQGSFNQSLLVTWPQIVYLIRFPSASSQAPDPALIRIEKEFLMISVRYFPG